MNSRWFPLKFSKIHRRFIAACCNEVYVDDVVAEAVGHGRHLSLLCTTHKPGPQMADYALNLAEVIAYDYYVTAH
jgi:hypothetical protein